MNYFDLEHERLHLVYRARDLQRRADQERLAASLRHQSRRLRVRFYYPVLARFGRWLIVSGQRLQGRYGEICERPASARHPVHRGI